MQAAREGVGREAVARTTAAGDRSRRGLCEAGGSGTATGGSGGAGNTPTTGQLSIWTDYSTAITVGVDGGAAGTLTQYFPNSTPTCGQSGTLTLTLPVGVHQVSGSSGSVSWGPTAVTVAGGGCLLFRLAAPSGGAGSGGTGGSTGGVGRRFVLCASGLASYNDTQWAALPAPLDGLDARLYYSTTYGTADVVFRNRYVQPIHFDEVVYPYGVSPAPVTQYRHDLAAEAQESPPGPNVGVDVGLGGSACVVVDRVRFGDDSGPYFTRRR